MTKLPVAKLVGKNRDNLLSLALLNEGVINDDVLLPRQTKEIGVAVGAALASVDDIQLVEGELELLGKILYIRLQLAFLQGRELIEERQDGDRVDRNHENLETSAKHPEVVKELITGLLDDAEETREDRRGENDHEQVRLGHISNEQLRCLLVEPKLLFQDKSVVDTCRE